MPTTEFSGLSKFAPVSRGQDAQYPGPTNFPRAPLTHSPAHLQPGPAPRLPGGKGRCWRPQHTEGFWALSPADPARGQALSATCPPRTVLAPGLYSPVRPGISLTPGNPIPAGARRQSADPSQKGPSDSRGQRAAIFPLTALRSCGVRERKRRRRRFQGFLTTHGLLSKGPPSWKGLDLERSFWPG